MTDQERNSKIAVLRELLESGPCAPNFSRGGYDFGREDMHAEWRDHITAKIKELEGAGDD